MDVLNFRKMSSSYLIPVAMIAAMIFLGEDLSVAADLGAVSAPTISKQAPTPATATGAIEPAAQGMRVYIDPITKKLREPTQEELAAPPDVSATTLNPAPQKVLAGPHGSVGMVLDESHMVHSVATINPDGSVSMDCITGKANAEKALTKTPRSGQPAGKEARDEK